MNRLREVTSCIDCPFVDDRDDNDAGEVGEVEWLCHAEYNDDGHPRLIDKTNMLRAAFVADVKPPTWCPLRHANILVALTLPKHVNAELVTVGPVMTHDEALYARRAIAQLRSDDDGCDHHAIAGQSDRCTPECTKDKG